MAENVIDTLKLDIIVNTKQNGQSITTLRNSLEKLYKFLNGVKDQDFSKISSDIAKIGGGLTPLINAINSLDGQGLKNLTSLGTRLQTLNKRMGEIDAKAMAHKFEQMTQAITPFIDKVMSAQEALVALNNVMGGAKTLTKTATPKATTITTPKATTNTNILGGNLGKSLNLGSMVAKLYFVRNITKQLGQNLAKVVQYGIDYEETLNLWQVAMKGNTAEARKFITEMNRAYGISEATLMNYQAIFKNMLSALGGVSHDIAYDLSELMTQMALDYASLYNVGIEESMTKFQAVLAGQVRPIRNESGYDITQATLFEVYKDIGGTKTVRQLSETEKRLLRILAVYRQMRDTAVGDLEKTITSSANQLRLMGDTIKDIATWIGVGANQWLQQSKILIRINAYLLALRELAKSFAVSMGYIEPTGEDNKSAEQKQTDNLLEGAEGTADAYKEANKQVDELQGKLLGFDKFQVLSSAGVGETNTDIDKILEELQKAKEEYQGILDQSQNIALFGDAEKNIKGAYDILKDWGYEYDEQSKQWLKDGKTVKENIQDIGKALEGIFAFVGLMTKPWLVLVYAIEKAYWTNEDFRKSVNSSLEKLGGAGIKVFQSLGELFVEISPYLVKIVEKFTDIVDLLDELGLLEETIGLVVVGLIAWKNAQTILNIRTFVKNLQTQIRVMRLLRTETTMLNSGMLLAGTGVGKLGMIMQNTYTKTMLLVAGMSLLSSGFMDLQGWSDMSGLERASTILKIVAGAAFLAAAAIASFHTAWSVGVAAGAIGVGIAAIVASMATASAAAKDMQKGIEAHANGGLATKGSLFYAGEAGPELVTRTSGGNSTIMNMAQLENAVAKGMFRALAGTQANESEQVVNVGIDGQNLFTIFRGVAKRNGYDLVKVN
jgi:hypothetical protein